MRSGITNIVSFFVIIILSLGLVLSILVYNKPLSDFGNYYFGSLFFIHGENTWTTVYDVANFNKAIINKGYNGLFLSHTSVPPQSLLFYIPLTFISNPYLAKFIFNLFSILIFCLCLHILYKREKISFRKAICLILIGAVPLYYNILFGQSYLLIATVLLLLLKEPQKNKHVLAFLFAISISIKISPIVFLVYYFVKKQFGFVLLTGFYYILIIGLAYTTVGGETVYNYYIHFFPKLMSGFINDPFSPSYHNVIVLLRKIFLYDEMLNPTVITALKAEIIYLLGSLVTVLILFFVLRFLSSDTISKPYSFVILLLFIFIVSGYTSSYSLFIFLPVLLVLEEGSWAFYLFVALACLLPPGLFENVGFLLAHYKLYIFILLLWLTLKGTLPATVNTPSLALLMIYVVSTGFNYMVITSTKPVTYFNTILLPHQYIPEAILKNDTLNYTYFSEKGSANDALFLQEITNCNMFKNTVHFMPDGSQIKVIGCSHDSILFLSDYNRGPGLYNIYTASVPDFNDIIEAQ